MEQIDYFLRLEEVAPGVEERYYVIVNRTGHVSASDHNLAYDLIGGGVCIATCGIDASEIANEFLEDFCGESAEEYMTDPIVIYGAICDPAAIKEEWFDDFFVFFPEVVNNVLRGYRLFTISGTETVVDLIETVMKEEAELEIEDVVLFRGEEVELTTQMSVGFDQSSMDELLDGEKEDG